MSDAETQAELRAVVEQHGVCFDVWPLREMRDGELRQVGFEIDLVGGLAHAEQACSPGCSVCQTVYDELRRVAEAVVAGEQDGIRVEIEDYDASFHESRQRGFREDIELQMQIYHDADYDRPVDGAELACLQRIEAALRALGVREGRH